MSGRCGYTLRLDPYCRCRKLQTPQWYTIVETGGLWISTIGQCLEGGWWGQRDKLTAAGELKSHPAPSYRLLQYTFEPATAGSQILKQNASEPMKLQAGGTRIFDSLVYGRSITSKPNASLVPLNHLLEAIVIAVIAGESIGIYEPAKGISALQKRLS